MKDYYYILGLSAQATSGDIKTAYRKLSTKFHPDKNGSDAFFEERFKEIQEAYDTLSRPDRRATYDQAFGQRFRQPGTPPNATPPNYTNFYPTIESFTASPAKIYDGNEVEFSWNVFNADSIQIEKIGNVPAKGKKRIKILGLRSAKSISVSLSATNTHIGKSEKKSVEIFNQDYKNYPNKTKQEDDTPIKKGRKDFLGLEPSGVQTEIALISIIVIILILYTFIKDVYSVFIR